MTDLLKQYLYVDQTIGDPAIPYLSAADFPGLICETDSFINDDGRRVNFFYYSYPGNHDDRLVLFIHGIGPGHKAYLREIETLAGMGYRVLTYDAAGSGSSEGEGFLSLYSPLKDAEKLLQIIEPEREILLFGHSLGGFTALHLMALHPELKKAVIIAGFYGISWSSWRFTDAEQAEINAYEKAYAPQYFDTDVEGYLHTTDDDILFIHSTGDPVSPFETWTGHVQKDIKNPHLSFYVNSGRGHNPNYSQESVDYLNQVLKKYTGLISGDKPVSPEERLAYMSDKSPMRMTNQDEKVWEKIKILLAKP